MIQVYCKNTGTSNSFREGTTLLDMLPVFGFDRPYPIVSAKVNNVSQGLKFRVYNSRTVEFVDATASSGMRVYIRSLCFLLCKAARDVFRGSHIFIEHPISHGYYCDLHKADKSPVTQDDINKIKQRMHWLVEKNLPFHRFEAPTEQVIDIMHKAGAEDKVKLLETSGQVYMDYYSLGKTKDYYYGRLVPSTGYLDVWDLRLYHGGMLLIGPSKHDPTKLAPYVDQPKTFNMFNENLKWNDIMGLNTVGDLNKSLLDGNGSDLIQIAEALQEKKIVKMAEEIHKRYLGPRKLRLVLITGPSSSGKTTVSKRLAVQLKACGLRPLIFSTDDYSGLTEDMEEVPMGWNDPNYDIYTSFYTFFFEPAKNVGLQTIYRGGDEERHSNVVLYDLATSQILNVPEDDITAVGLTQKDDAQTVSTQWNDAAGRQVSPASKGFIIRTDVYRDGTRKSYKLIRK